MQKTAARTLQEPLAETGPGQEPKRKTKRNTKSNTKGILKRVLKAKLKEKNLGVQNHYVLCEKNPTIV